jgi:cytoskeleton protein RodZ
MTSIGDTLRRERHRRNLELPKIAGELKISTRFLEAMEHDEFAKLPGGVFTKSFVRQYASFLGLDAEELAAEVEHAVEPEADVRQFPGKPKPDVPGIELQIGEDWQSVSQHRAPLPSWVRAGVLLIVLMLMCSGVYWWWQRPRHPVLAHEPAAKAIPAAQSAAPIPQPAENPPVATTPPVTDQAPATEVSADPIGQSSAKPASSEPAATPQTPVSPPNPNATVRVGIVADEAVWVRADVNGKIQFSGTLQPHETRNIDADGEVTLRLGNAGGVTLTLNGKPIGAVGPKGQIRIVQFTSSGFQVVAASKLVDPLDQL